MSKSAREAALVMLPGLGADARLFEPQAQYFPNSHVPPWLPAQQWESMQAYARRFAATVQVDQPMVLVGISFGGMLALELARFLKPRAVIMIAGCRSRHALPLRLTLLSRLGPWLPHGIANAKYVLPLVMYRRLGAQTEAQQQLCHDMLQDASNPFMRWIGHAITTWPGVNDPGVPVFHIHGDCDRVILSSRVQPDAWVEGGGHMINVTHADQVNAFIEQAIARCL